MKLFKIVFCVFLAVGLCACGQADKATTQTIAVTEKEESTEETSTLLDKEMLEMATRTESEETTESIETTETETTTKGMITGTISVQIPDVSLLPAGTVLSPKEVEIYGEDNCFTVSEISDEVFSRMWGLSYKEYCTVPREELRYIRCLHTDIDGNIMIGELVMNVAVADEVCEIFHKLYKASFPIEKMNLIDDYGAIDDYSIYDNNTSAFNYRTIAGTDTLSNHAYGLAIDINPYYNVYYEPANDYVFPAECYEYKYRDRDFIYKVGPGDLCYELFMEAGFDWGGWWEDTPDYQHFEKVIY